MFRVPSSMFRPKMLNVNLHVSNEVDDLLNFQLSQSANSVCMRTCVRALVCVTTIAFSQSVIDASDL